MRKRTSFLDLMMLGMVGVTVLFSLAVAQMNPPPNPGESVEQKAEIIIEMDWPEGSLDDIDLWLLTPDKQSIGFNRQDAGLATLDRDDRGYYGDVVDLNNPRLIRINREVIAIRAVLPGRYVVNAHFYADFGQSLAGFEETHTGPIPLKLSVTDLNPKVSKAGEVTKTIELVDQQITLMSFEVDAKGAVINVDTTADLPFIATRKDGS